MDDQAVLASCLDGRVNNFGSEALVDRTVIGRGKCVLRRPARAANRRSTRIVPRFCSELDCASDGRASTRSEAASDLRLCHRDSVILSATCTALGNIPVAVKQYAKGRLSASKIRAIKREAAMMALMTRKQCA